jgi:hypothetical protein
VCGVPALRRGADLRAVGVSANPVDNIRRRLRPLLPISSFLCSVTHAAALGPPNSLHVSLTRLRRQTCTDGHQTEYKGQIMASHYTQQRSMDVCVDYAEKEHTKSSGANSNGALLYPTEMEKGAADENKYPHNVEVGCAVCSVMKRFEGAVYTRWGAKTCPAGANLLYEGFMSGAMYNHRGSAVNYLCMHPNGQRPKSHANSNDNGNLLCAFTASHVPHVHMPVPPRPFSTPFPTPPKA